MTINSCNDKMSLWRTFMKDILITEISEEDFRKLDIEVFCHERTGGSARMEKYKINDILDHNINYILNSGLEEELEELQTPVTIDIHKENTGEFGGYLDKFMNRFSGMQTFQMGWGIKHLYSTRDYFECREDYWRVAKKETAVVYRIHLDPKWINKFVVKHKKEISKVNENEWYETIYHLNELTGEWEEGTTSRVVKEGQRTTIEKVNKEQHEPDMKKMA